MLRHDRKRTKTDFFEPDLPITPMLDMSFQLLAFFIMAFRPAVTENQLTLALPKADGGKTSPPPSPILDDTKDKPVHYIVRVVASDKGA
ncbi:MAG: biopolymer transporter ExbD, partial [Gemmataceae bacterium]|nr:biopolymer transporter ExbD [Gemmataceae bacterium]